jgi:manganese oxidase
VSCVAGLRASKGVRLYYIAATEVDWDYAPSGINGLTSRSFLDSAEADAARYMVQSDKYLGRKVKKVQFVEYTDKSFSTAKAADPQWAHKGILGPVIRAEVGDAIRVVFRNMDTERQYSINARGVFYDKANEGVRYTDGSRRRRLLWSRDSGSMALSGGGGFNKLDDAIEPQTTFVYNWNVPERAGPGPEDPSSVVWTYQSMADGEFDLFTGLIGPIIVTRKGMGGPDRKPVDVDREMIAFFVNFNEDESHKRDANIARLTPTCGTPGHEECHYADDDVFDSQQKRAINGYMYDNIPDMTMLVGERVRWYLLAMGNEVPRARPRARSSLRER